MASDIGLTIDNRYQVLGELGRGGMGVVYRAADLKMDRVVAIKVLTAHVVGREEYRERFLREAKSVAKLQHPNIVVVYDYGEHAGSPYMAMEYVEGTPLDKVIASGANLSLLVKLDYIIQVCHALHYAHQFSIVHRDVKPGNIMVLEGGQRVKLLDFGIARAGGASNLSKSGLAMGTIYYMSPQQTRGQKDLDGRADIFSLGVVLYELLGGVVPWTGDSDYEIMSKVIADPFPPLSNYLQEYPPALDGILERALAKEVTARYQKADDLAADLAEIQTPLEDEMVTEARACLLEGDPLRAYELVSQVLRIDTRHGEAIELRGRLQGVEHLDEKVERLRKARSEAEQAVGEKRYEDALAAIDEAIALNSSNTELRQYRELIQQELKRRADIHKRLELARRAEEINDLDSAQELVDKALELDPTDTQARMMKAVLERRAAEEQQHARLRQLEEQVRRGLAAHRFTDVHEAIRQIEAVDANFGALPALKKAAVEGYAQEMRRREVEGVVHEAQQALAGGDFQRALAITEQALAKFPGETAIARVRAQAESRREAFAREQAIQEQIAAVRKLRDDGQIAEAQQAVEAALSRFGADSRLQIALQQLRDVAERERQGRARQEVLANAREALRAGDCDGAIRLLSDALIDFPESKEIADALRLSREEAARRLAESDAEKARQRHMAEALQLALAGEADPDAQVRMAEKALESHPGNALMEQMLVQARVRRQQIAACVERAGKLEAARSYAAAIEEWERVRELYPQHPHLEPQVARLNRLAAEARAPSARPAPEVSPVPAGAAAAAPKPALEPPPVPARPVRDLSATMVLSAKPAKPEPPMAEAPAVSRPPASVRMPAAAPLPERNRKLPILIASAVVLAVALMAAVFVFLRPAPTTLVRFESAPAGASIAVAGQTCSSPCELKLGAGDYVAKASREGYEPMEKSISVGAGPQTVSLQLTAAAKAARLAVETNVETVDVLVDGELKGVTSGTRATLSLLPGAHKIRGEKAGYEPADQQVEVAAGRETSVQLALKKVEGPAAPVRDPFLIIKTRPGARVVVDKAAIGSVPGDGTYSFQLKPGRHQVEVSLSGYEPWASRVTAQAGESVVVDAALKEIPKPPAAVLSFGASASIQAGQSTELRWQTRNATEISIDHGLGAVEPSGARAVSPTMTTTYTLTARGDGEPAQRSVTITVATLAKPSIVTFDSGAEKIQQGQSTKLIWATQNATEVAIDPIGPVPPSGSREVSPGKSTSYTLTAKSAGGTVTQSLQVTVEAAAAPPPKTVAPVENPDVKAIKDTIARYKDAYESMSIDEVQNVWPSIPRNKKDAIKESFKSVRAIKVRHECSEPVISGDSAQCACSETIAYTTDKVQRAQPVSVLFVFRKSSGSWFVQDHRAR